MRILDELMSKKRNPNKPVPVQIATAPEDFTIDGITLKAGDQVLLKNLPKVKGTVKIRKKP